MATHQFSLTLLTWKPRLAKFRLLRRKLRQRTRHLHPMARLILEHLADGLLKFFEDHWVEAKATAAVESAISQYLQWVSANVVISEESSPIGNAVTIGRLNEARIEEEPSNVPDLPTFTITGDYDHD